MEHPQEPMLAETFSDDLRAFTLPPVAIIAVSGGRDSIALTHLCAEISVQIKTRFIAVTVDHGLRLEARAEASTVAQWCAALGLDHKTLKWEGEKPTTGLQAAARDARYRLLCHYANAVGAGAILTAHTQDDGAETMLMRLARGGGVSALAGIAPERKIAVDAGAPVRLIRPMLGYGRDQITDYLAEQAHPYIDDPSNEDHVFERVRMRTLLCALSEQNILSAPALSRTANQIRRDSRLIDHQICKDIDHFGGCFHRWGGITFSAQMMRSLRTGNDIEKRRAVSVMARALSAVGTVDHLRPNGDIHDLFSSIDLQDGGKARLSIAGVLIDITPAAITLYREPAAFLGRGPNPMRLPVTIPAKGSALWDRRFIIENRSEREMLINGCLADTGSTLMPSLAQLTFPDSKQSGVTIYPLIKERFFRDVHRFVTPNVAS